MTRSEAAGSLLVLSFAVWFGAAALPSRIWTAPLGDRLALIAERRRTWQAVNLAIAAAAVLLVLGFVLLAAPLERSGAGYVVPASLATLGLGAALWLTSLTFRLTALTAETGPTPALELVAAWAGGLFVAWTILCNAAVIGFGAAIAACGYPAAWAGWAAVVIAGLMLAQLLVTGDGLPALYHVAPAVIGVALLLD
jgi:hypothetical protein